MFPLSRMTTDNWYPVWQHTFVSPSAFSRRAVVSYWRKYVHEVLVNRLGGLSLPRKSVVRLTDRPDMTLDVYHGRKTTIQQQQLQITKSVLWNFAIIQVLPFLNNLKDLDLSYKTDLDFWDFLEGKKLCLLTQEKWYTFFRAGNW